MELSLIRFPRTVLTWMPDEGTYRCPAGRQLILARVKTRREIGKDLIFRINPPSTCTGCQDHATCGHPNKPPHRREVVVRVSHEESDELLRIVTEPVPPQTDSDFATSPGRPVIHNGVAYGAQDAGPYVLSPPCFMPAEHRSYLLSHMRRVRVHVDIIGKPELTARFPDVESVWAARQHRRHTWTRRKSVNRLTLSQSVSIAFQGLGKLAPLVNSWQPDSSD